MEQNLKIIGSLLVILSLIHAVFPRYFNWENELKSLALINRQIMYVHTLFIGLILFLMGLLCFTSYREMMDTNLGKRLALGFCIFWTIRLVIQLFGYSSKLWKGKKFETTVHVVFVLLWTYFSVVFFLIYWQ